MLTPKEEFIYEFTRPANIISMVKIPLAVIMIIFFDNLVLFFIIFGLAMATDLLDGCVARKQGVTKYGAAFDGASDKLFFAILLIFMVLNSNMLLWQMLLLMIRDIAVAAMGAIFYFHPKVERIIPKMKSSWPSKLTTTGQFVAVMWAVLGFDHLNLVVYAVALTALIAAVDYAVFIKKNL
ncbi:CDP-alcohol phosphatidyltransferase family protein [Candidatus Woesearchaeota archaeon]|nr:CDP-alcohol phosphatidyltransferase family protein [Candidatus Woesearchaeota archaeon]